MTQSPQSRQVQPLLVAASVAFTMGTALSIFVLNLRLPGHICKALLLLALALAIFGLGEFLNHPRRRLITPETVKGKQEPQFHRKRKTCGLGNLLDICAVITLFLALSAFLYPH